MMKMHKVEHVVDLTENFHATVERVSVPGGWIYVTLRSGSSGGVSQCFVPDPLMNLGVGPELPYGPARSAAADIEAPMLSEHWPNDGRDEWGAA